MNNGGDIIGWLEHEEQAIQTENPIVVDWMARIATSVCLLTEVLSRIAGRGSQHERTNRNLRNKTHCSRNRSWYGGEVP